MTRPPQIAGVILAGGRSQRMGQSKQHLRLPNGQTMLEIVAHNLARACDTIVLATNGDQSVFLDGYSVVRDHYPGAGPLAGFEAALKSGIANAYLFVGCDQPWLTGDTLSLLLKGDPLRARFFCAQDRAKFHSLPAYLPAHFHYDVRNCLERGERSIHRLANLIDPEPVPIPHGDETKFLNVNSPEDLSIFYASRSEQHAD